MKKYIVSLITLSALLSQTAEAFQKLSSASAIQSAMGNTIIANSGNVFSGTANPALLSTMISETNFQLSSRFRNFTEERKFPAYSAFDSQIGNEIYAASSYNKFKYNFGLSRKFKIADYDMTVALSRQNNMSNDYFYSEAVRSRESGKQNILGYQEIEQNGDLYETNLALATEFNGYNFGLSLSFVSVQDYSYRKEILLTEFADDDLVNKFAAKAIEDKRSFSQDNQPLKLRFGFLVPVMKNLKIGGAVATAYDIEYKSNSKTIKNHMPYQSAAGLEYYAGNKLRSKFTFDWKFIAWSDYSVNDGNKNLFDDVYSYHFGFEHLVKNLPLRLGLQFENSKVDKNIQTTRFSVGTGIKVNKFQIDLATDYSYRAFSEKDLFPEATWINRGNPFSERNSVDEIDQSYLNFMVSFSYIFED